jgi:hypothetical protein
MNSMRTGGSRRDELDEPEPSKGGVYGGVSIPSLSIAAAAACDLCCLLLLGATSKREATTYSHSSARAVIV